MAWPAGTRARGPLTCLTFLLVLRHVTAIPSRPRGDAGIGHTEHLKRTPGGTSRGGSSASRDELRNRLSALRRSVLKDLAGVYDTGPQQAPASTKAAPCSWESPDDLQRMLPGRFLSEADLSKLVSQTNGWVQMSRQGPTTRPSERRVVPQAPTGGTASGQGTQEAAFNDKADFSSFSSHSSMCRTCMTEIGYEVKEHIVDFKGVNHTVINFKNAYQFIPSGRCLNEHSPCGQPGWRCRQVTRAHWSLVWTPGVGVNLVAHEVPSHCQCLNLGLPSQPRGRPHPSTQPGFQQGRSTRGQGDGGERGGGGVARGVGWAGLNMENHPHPCPLPGCGHSNPGHTDPDPLADTRSDPSTSHADPVNSRNDPTITSRLGMSPYPYANSLPSFPALSHPYLNSSLSFLTSSNSSPTRSNSYPITSHPYPVSSHVYATSSGTYPQNSDPSPERLDPKRSRSDTYPFRSHVTYPHSTNPDPYSRNSDSFTAFSQLSTASRAIPGPMFKSSSNWNKDFETVFPTSSSSSFPPPPSPTAVAVDDGSNAAVVDVSIKSTPSVDVKEDSRFTIG